MTEKLTTKILKDKTATELEKMLGLKRELLRDVNFRMAQKQLKNHQQARFIRKDIARIMTELTVRKQAK